MKKPLNVGLVQINNSFSAQEYLPLSIGLLHAYFQKYSTKKDRFRFLPYVFRREALEECMQKLEEADIVGFSVYMWNLQISKEIARTLKARRPETLIIFGGPQVPNQAETFLRQHPYIDILCHGEGEDVFMQILNQASCRDWTGIQSVSYLKAEGTFECNQRVMRIADLAQVPSPYLEGFFDTLMESESDNHWLALWETNRGCPFSCTFCEWGMKSYNKVNTFEMARLRAEMEWFAHKRIEFVFCCDANFGLLERDVKIADFVVKTKRSLGFPHAFSVQSSKNATEKVYRIQKILSENGLSKGVLLAVQSVNPPTLEKIERANISMADFDELQRRFRKDGIQTFTDMIIGLPDETYDSFATGISQVIERGQHNRIQFINLSILGNSAMGDPEYRRKYKMRTVESPLINVHGSLGKFADKIQETQNLVVETSSMSSDQWIRSRVLAWVTALIYFDKLLQVPLAVLSGLYSVTYRDLLEAFSEGVCNGMKIIPEIREFLRKFAMKIQQGGPEYCYSKKWLNIWWPVDELLMINICSEGQLAGFYDEAKELLLRHMRDKNNNIDVLIITEAINLNRELLKLPFQGQDKTIRMTSNVLEIYQSVLAGTKVHLEKVDVEYTVKC
ncbi:MAG: cobalamin-dependent protein [Kiritimatiellae bacterium]|nr:cobalamin-dependent protein [Kiritimatiellia bacterium]